MVKKLNKEEFFVQIKRADKPIVIDFTADWCPYCKKLAPIVEEVAKEYEDQIAVYFLDIDENEEIAEQYEVMTIPTIVIFSAGEIVTQAVNPGTKEALLDLIAV